MPQTRRNGPFKSPNSRRQLPLHRIQCKNPSLNPGFMSKLLIRPKRPATPCPILSALFAERVGEHDANHKGRINSANPAFGVPLCGLRLQPIRSELPKSAAMNYAIGPRARHLLGTPASTAVLKGSRGGSSDLRNFLKRLSL